jgi:hypothetical protein
MLFAVCHVHYKLHRAVAAATKGSALPFKVARTIGGDRHLGRMALLRCRVYMQAWNQETVLYIVGSDYQLDRFAFLGRDLRRIEGKTLCVNLNSASRFLRNGNWSSLDEAAYQNCRSRAQPFHRF